MWSVDGLKKGKVLLMLPSAIVHHASMKCWVVSGCETVRKYLGFQVHRIMLELVVVTLVV